MKHLKGIFRMMGALLGGRYKKAPWRSGLMLVVFVIYLLLPADLIADILPIVGLVDDAAVFGFFLGAVKKDVDSFLEWEERK